MLKFLFVVICGIFSTQFVVECDYVAAVVEYFPDVESNTQHNIIRKNIARYESQASMARLQGADIVVFPEYGLTGVQTDHPEEYAIIIPKAASPNPNFQNFSIEVFTRLSNIAAQQHIYIVVNLLENAVDNNNKSTIYNTNLVFGRNGSVIAKYRKINLYNEPNLASGKDIVTFTTDFGVTFGIFTCFDILYTTPARKMLDQKNVTDIIYPHTWFSTMPFYVATSLHHGYSQANSVNLLAANLNNPRKGNGGSGIYLADGRIADIYISPTEGSKLMIQRVTTSSTRPDKNNCNTVHRTLFGGFLPDDDDNEGNTDISNFRTQRDFRVSDYSFTPISLRDRNINKTVCHNKFCCNFEIVVKNTSSTNNYQIVIFNGEQYLGKKKEIVRFCSLIACSDSDKNSCGNRVKNITATFDFINVTTSLKNSTTSYIQPSTLTSELKPVLNNYCTQSKKDSNINYQVTSQETVGNLLVFGFYGSENSSMTVFQSSILLILISLFFSFINY